MSGFDVDDDGGPSPAPYTPPIAMGRTLPHSLEAEEYLLSSCLLDGADVVPRCLEARIKPDSFYDPKHAVVYRCIIDLYAQQKPIEVSIVAEELKKTHQLDSVGGYTFLAQVSSRIPTTAQADYFIKRVRDQALLRGVIRTAVGAVETAYNYSGEIDDFCARVRSQMEDVTSGSTGATQLLAERKFDPAAKVIEPRVAFALGGIPVCTAGNLSSFVARSGVGKSAVIGAMIAAAMSGGSETDCLGFVGMNFQRLPLLHFDTEQSKADYQKLLHRSLRRAGMEECPTWLHSYHLTGLTAPECRHMVEVAIAHHARKAGGIFAVIIDGWADLVVDPNDSEECFPFVSRMHALAIKHDMPIAGVLHLNPGSEAKSRGHLGSQLERKAETVLQLEMNEDLITAMWSTKKRGAPILKESGPRFQWDNDKQMHTLVADWQSVAAAKREEKKAKRKQQNPTSFSEKYSREELVSFYPASTAKPEPRAVIFRRSQEMVKISDSQVERFRGEFLKAGWVVSTPGGYRRTREGDDWAKRKPGADLPPPKQETIQL